MKNPINAGEEWIDRFGIVDIRFHDCEVFIVFETIKVLRSTGRVVVDNDDLVALIKEFLSDMTPDKACPTRDNATFRINGSLLVQRIFGDDLFFV